MPQIPENLMNTVVSYGVRVIGVLLLLFVA